MQLIPTLALFSIINGAYIKWCTRMTWYIAPRKL